MPKEHSARIREDPQYKIRSLEYKDKIYYEMAYFELKQGNLDGAIGYFKKSAASSVNNKRQKAYAYLNLGRIYYDSIKNFELAQAYYDSTVSVMPTDEEDYAKSEADPRVRVLGVGVRRVVVVIVPESRDLNLCASE